jgi:ribose transport system substrate-binding protein
MPDDQAGHAQDLASWRHETRNRLNIINGYASLLEMDEELTEVHQEFVREIVAATKEIQSLVDDLRDRVMPKEMGGSELRLDE